MGGVVKSIGKAAGNVFDFGHDVVDTVADPTKWIEGSTAPFEWMVSDPMQWLGKQFGINELSGLGKGMEGFLDNPMIQMLATALMGYGGSELLGGASGLEGGLSGIDLADFQLAADEFGGGAGWGATGNLDLAGIGTGGLSNAAVNTAGAGGLSKYLLPGAGLLAGSQYLGAQESQKASEDMFNKQQKAINQTQANALRTWQQTAFPNAAAVGAAKKGEQANIAQRTQLARTNLANQLASRGMGADSGLMGHEYAGIEKQKNLDMASLARELTKFQNTPQFAPPIMTQTAQYPGYETFGQNMAKMTSSAAGQMPLWYYMMNQMSKG